MAGWTSAVVGVTVAKLVYALVACALELLEHHGQSSPSIWLFSGLVLEFSAIACLLIWQSRHGDVRAQLLGVTLLLVAASFADPLLEIRATLSPGPFEWLTRALLSLRMDAWLPAYFWLFATRFPEALTSPGPRWWTQTAFRASVAVGSLLFLSNLLAWLPGRDGAAAWLKTFDVLLATEDGHFWTVLLLMAAPVLPFLAWRAHHSRADQRRRTMVFVGGLSLGLLPVAIEVLLEALIPRYGHMMQGAAGPWSAAAIYVLLAATPIVTAYSVLIDRVLDVRLFLRAAVQYSLARLTLLAASFVPFVVLSGYVYARRDRTLTQILSGPGPFVLLAFTVAALIALALRDRMILALDRRFFREGYDARLILRKLADEPRRSMDLRDLVSHVTMEIDRALHLQSIAMLVADERGQLLQSLDGRARPLPIASRLVAFFAEDQSPLEIDLEASHPLLRGLPQEDRQWLADAAARLLLPIVGSDGSLLGLLTLGEKRSELAFSRDDQALLAMIQGSLALSLENRRLRSSPSRSPGLLIGATQHSMDDAALECSECWSVHQPETAECPCGGRLRTAPVPYVLLGKFRFDKRIGAGGMGVVYRAVDLALDRPVAIKTLPQVSPEYAGRLRREARAMAVVSHPSLALIYGAEMWHGTPMLVCEYLGGGTLADRLRISRLPSEEALDLGLVIADVLAHIHGVGIVHCDIKPSNIGYMAGGMPKLLDFGLARLAHDSQQPDWRGDSTTRSGRGAVYPTAALGSTAPTDSRHFIGTPLYMCPEAINREPPSTLYDLWSLSVVLFEAIAGTPPFKGRAVLDILEQVTDTRRPDIREFSPDCPATLAEFFAAALARDPASRPQTAQAMRKALQALRSGLQTV